MSTVLVTWAFESSSGLGEVVGTAPQRDMITTIITVLTASQSILPFISFLSEKKKEQALYVLCMPELKNCNELKMFWM